ncbi:unnamed protein product, partial [Lampetra fluviatilis]
VAACELLHAVVIYMLGLGVTAPQGAQGEAPHARLYRHTLPVLLRLGCDADQVTRQLFEPLMMQIIHWFANNRTFESPVTATLLNTLFEGLVDPTDNALRDLSARCLGEFLSWSLRQADSTTTTTTGTTATTGTTTATTGTTASLNAKSVFRRVHRLALHPAASSRLGAALAFNSIYRHFREESTLVDEFLMEVLVDFVDCLALAHGDDDCQGTVVQCKAALGHICRIVRHKASSLMQPNKRRRTPRGFPAGATLPDLVEWLLLQCGRVETHCRQQCLHVFCQLVTMLP